MFDMTREDEAFEAWIDAWEHDDNGRMTDVHVARDAWARNKALASDDA